MKPRNFPARKNARRQKAGSPHALYGAKADALRAVRTKKDRSGRAKLDR